MGWASAVAGPPTRMDARHAPENEWREDRELREGKALALTELVAQVGYASEQRSHDRYRQANGGPRFIRVAARTLGCEIEDIIDGPQVRPSRYGEVFLILAYGIAYRR